MFTICTSSLALITIFMSCHAYSENNFVIGGCQKMYGPLLSNNLVTPLTGTMSIDKALSQHLFILMELTKRTSQKMLLMN